MDKKKRYVVTVDLYVYAEDDDEAKKRSRVLQRAYRIS